VPVPLPRIKDRIAIGSREKHLLLLQSLKLPRSLVLGAGNQTISKWYVQPLLEFYVAVALLIVVAVAAVVVGLAFCQQQMSTFEFLWSVRERARRRIVLFLLLLPTLPAH